MKVNLRHKTTEQSTSGCPVSWVSPCGHHSPDARFRRKPNVKEFNILNMWVNNYQNNTKRNICCADLVALFCFMVAKSIGTWLGNWKVTSSTPGKPKCYRGVPEQGTVSYTAPRVLYIVHNGSPLLLTLGWVKYRDRLYFPSVGQIKVFWFWCWWIAEGVASCMITCDKYIDLFICIAIIWHITSLLFLRWMYLYACSLFNKDIQ